MDEFRLDFVGIGAAKAGTTWLAACLGEHPEVCMSKPKELSYFCRSHILDSGQSQYDRGERWLRRRFSGCASGQLRGEFSVSYLVDPESAELIEQHFPAAKVLVSLRNPTDALYSLYHQAAKEYPVPDTFEAFLEKHPRYIEYGFYYSHIRRFLDRFPAERIHTILYDDICIDPNRVLTSLSHFLDIAPVFEPSLVISRVNVRQVPRYRLVRDVLGGTTEFMRMNPAANRLKGFLNRLGLHHMVNWIQAKNLRSAPSVPLREDTRTWLLEAYEPHNQQLGEWLGKDLNHWNE